MDIEWQPCIGNYHAVALFIHISLSLLSGVLVVFLYFDFCHYLSNRKATKTS